MRYVLTTALILTAATLFAAVLVDLNFFVEPQFETDFDFEIIKHKAANDTIPQINIAAGRIFAQTTPDSLLLHNLELMGIDYASPVGFMFGYDPALFATQIISANVVSDSATFQRSIVIPQDGYTVGITSIYTPDYAVKFPIDELAEFRFDIFDIAKKQTQYLSHFTDFVILLSNAGLYIDRDLVEGLPVDVMVSFDYQTYNQRILNSGRTNYFSIRSDSGEFGKLRIFQRENELRFEWSEHQFK